MAFSPQKNLLLLDKDVLELLLTSFGVVATDIKDGAEAQELYEKLQDTEKFQEIEAFLREADEMANEEAMERIKIFADQRAIALPDKFYTLTNEASKSLWLLLKHKELFDEVFLWDQLNDYGSQYDLSGDLALDNDFFTVEKLSLLESALLKEFKTESRAQNCEVRKSYNPKTQTVCLSVFFDDVSKSELGFEKKKLRKFPRRPVRQLHFLIFLEERKVALQFRRARYKRKAALLSLFLDKVFGQEFDEAKFRPLNLDPFINRDFEVKIPAEEKDLIDFVRVKQIRLDKRINYKASRLMFDVKDGDNRDDIYNLMESLNIKTEVYQVSQVTVHFKFKNMGKRGSVTVTLTMPNSDTLKDSVLHKKCRNYLQQSGIIR